MHLIKVQFPPRVTVEEIVQKQLNNNIKNVNHTVNSFIIYRREFNREIRESRFKFKLKEISTLAAVSWKTEPKYIKDHYKKMAKDVKKCFEKWVQSTCFIDSNKKSNRKKKKIATSSNISFNNDSPSSNHPSQNQNHTYTNESISPIAMGSNNPQALIPLLNNHVNTDEFINPIATDGKISPYTSNSPFILLLNQPSKTQNCVNINEDEFFINYYPYFFHTSISGQLSQYLVSRDFNSPVNGRDTADANMETVKKFRDMNISPTKWGISKKNNHKCIKNDSFAFYTRINSTCLAIRHSIQFNSFKDLEEALENMVPCDRIFKHDGIKADITFLGKALSGGVYPASAIKKLCYVSNPEKMVQLDFYLFKLVRERKLLNALVIDENKSNKTAWQICLLLKSRGLLARPTHQNVIRLTPGLNITEEL
ncbi:hypothetical protein Glove_74g126 [Diversispora epigaea]|uniref:HMG box domain-containing protein n=1 Tax=Diversispora epigaea TaxID=1348612 RepID=A0A397JFW2_9GLOM|nr:hypothetical protein Glove_74g126 [Diversispora epigaea]